MNKQGNKQYLNKKVFWANDAFTCKMNDLILWHKSPMECRQYPEKSQTNWCTYRKHAHLFEYDKNVKKCCTRGLKIQMKLVS